MHTLKKKTTNQQKKPQTNKNQSSLPAGETWGQLLIFNSLSVSLLLATSTLRDGSSTGVSSILSEERDLEFTNTTVSAEIKWDWEKKSLNETVVSEIKISMVLHCSQQS